jgi:hypothetical protein
LACTFASPSFDCKPKAKVATIAFQKSLLLIIERKLEKNQFLQCLKFLPYFQNGFPTTIWVKPYLGGTIKITGIVGFILINERKIFKK